MNSSVFGVAATAVVVVALMGGCSSTACTAIGAESGVSVDISGQGRGEPITATACVEGHCSDTSVQEADGPIFIANSKVTSEEPTRVTVTVRRQSGAVLVPSRETTVTPKRVQPNGPDCDPTAYVATVSVAP